MGGAALISGLSFLIYGMATSVTTDKLVIAQTFGQYQAFLRSSNYAAAYRLMSMSYTEKHSLVDFEASDKHSALTSQYANCDLKLGAKVKLRGSHAELSVVENDTFGVSFLLIKEGGYWRLEDMTFVFERW